MYEIPGLRIQKYSPPIFMNGARYEAITYKGFLCKIVVASDGFGTRIIWSGKTWGPAFESVGPACFYLAQNKKEAENFFRGVYLLRLKEKLSRRYLRILYYKVKNLFFP